MVSITLGVSALAGRPTAAETVLHLGVLAAFVVLAEVTGRLRAEGPRETARGVLVFAVMFFLYGSLGQAVFQAIPWSGDPWLRALDQALALGQEPVLVLSEVAAGSRATVEALSFFYGAFIPYLYLSIFLGLVARPPATREEFTTAFAVLYAVSFLGYLFVPARGPVVEMAASFGRPLEAGVFHEMVVASIDRMGGPHGAFPSLHLGASFMVCLFELRRGDPLRGLVYVPLVALIAVSTVALRYHFVVDLVAGAAFAVLALWAAARLSGSDEEIA